MSVNVYLYSRVSTIMQTEGYSLEAQKNRMRAYAEFQNFNIVGEYEDAGASGKSIEDRTAFNQMIQDIQDDKDSVSYVLVYKLSRFARNAADVLSTLQIMQDFGINLICVDDGIDSSKDSGKLMISVLSAVAEIERENIRTQTMAGRIQKAKEGKWNGGFAPYGYKLINGELVVNEEEAETIRMIYDLYVNTSMGSTGVEKHLRKKGIHKIIRQNGSKPYFYAELIRKILKNPVYSGKIAYGRRKLEKIHGTRNKYHVVEQDKYIVVDGIHEPIIDVDTWNKAQIKLQAQSEKHRSITKRENQKIHLLSGLLKCPICGQGLLGNKSIKRKKDGSKYKDFYYYGCKHRKLLPDGSKCTFRKQINEEIIDKAVAKVISNVVNKKEFKEKFLSKIDLEITSDSIVDEIEQEEKRHRQYLNTKKKILEEINEIDLDDKHFERRKEDLETRLYLIYDKLEEIESKLISLNAKKNALEEKQVTAENIYGLLLSFDKIFDKLSELEKRKLVIHLIDEIHIYEERQDNGQWLKDISFKFPIVKDNTLISLDSENRVECVVWMTKNAPK